MKDKLKKMINGNIVISIILTLLGVFIAIFPKTALSIFSYSFGAILLAYGVYLLVNGRRGMFNPFGFSILGIALIVVGINAFVYRDRFFSFLPVVLGIWFIGSSINKLRMSSGLKTVNTGLYVFALILAFVSMGIGVYFVFYPFEAEEVITMVLGILLAVYAIADLVDMILFKKNLHELDKNISKKYKNIAEGEIIENTKK